MRLSIPPVAALSIFGAGVYAFAPPKGSTRSDVSRLLAKPVTSADYDLSGMLTDYSGSSPSTAATKTVEKVAEAVAAPAAVAPPPVPEPPAVDVSDVAESAIDAVSKAASAAQDAADQAAAAAAAVAAKSAAATKAAATAGASVAGGIQLKPLVGGVFVPSDRLPFQVDPAKVNTDLQFDASARAKANLATLKANFMAGVDSITGGSSGSGAVRESSGDSFSLDISNFKLGDGSISPDAAAALNDIIAALHLKEFAGWYAAGAMAIVASQQRSAGKEEAGEAFEAELADAKAKASEAASAAGLAAEGANTAKKLAQKMEKDLQKDGGQALLESSRSKMVQMEKEMMEKEMLALKAEVASLKSQLAKATESEKKATTAKKVVKTEIEEEYPTKVVVDTGADEDGRIIELLKEIDEENKKKQAEELEKKREEEAKFVAAEKTKAESKKMTKGVEAAQKTAEAAKKKKAATKKTAKKAATKKAASKRKSVTKTPEKKAPSTTVASADDWASLAESTLKRKTVAQLTEYLSEKGVSVTDDSGKALKKADLLVAVKSL